jgi:hypothetical protein
LSEASLVGDSPETAYVSIRQHTSLHTSAYVSIRQHTSAYVIVGDSPETVCVCVC